MELTDTPERRRMLGKKIRALRKLYEWTQNDLKHRLGYASSGTVPQIESGKIFMKQEKLIEAARIFNVPLEVLVSPDEMETETLEMIINVMKLTQKPIKSKYYETIKDLLKLALKE